MTNPSDRSMDPQHLAFFQETAREVEAVEAKLGRPLRAGSAIAMALIATPPPQPGPVAVTPAFLTGRSSDPTAPVTDPSDPSAMTRRLPVTWPASGRVEATVSTSPYTMSEKACPFGPGSARPFGSARKRGQSESQN